MKYSQRVPKSQVRSNSPGVGLHREVGGINTGRGGGEGGEIGNFWQNARHKPRGRSVHSSEAELGTWAKKRCSVGMWDRVVL